jgi:heme exporter protein C
VKRPDHVLLALGGGLFAVGQVLALYWAPPELHQGDAARMMYAHVPTSIVMMMMYSIATVFALLSLFMPRPRWDQVLEASVEVGVVLNALCLVTGSIWSRPTFGVWWEWEPQITFATIMLVTYFGVVLLRKVVDDPDKRSLWSAVATVMSFATVPLTYFVVSTVAKLHQDHSDPMNLTPPMLVSLRVNLFAVVLVSMWLLSQRLRVAAATALAEAPPPLPVKTS